jgi:uncharacterized protein DUF3943
MRFHNSIALVGALFCAVPRLAWAEVPSSAPSANYFVDPLRGSVSFESEYDLWFGDDNRPTHYGRAALEALGTLVVGTTYYWIVSNPNKVDWDYVNLEDRALHTDVKFDNNMFRTNFLLHPLAGTMSYWLARSNGLSIYASAASSALTSATFEFLLEWLEKPSINDLVVTPLGGVAGGEFFYQLSNYLNSSFGRDSATQRAFAWSLGLPQAVHHTLDGGEIAPAATRDSLGYSSAYWHRFGFGYGIADVAGDHGDHQTVYDLFFDAELAAMPGFGRPGVFGVDFHEGNFTEGHLRTSVAGGLLKDVDLRIASNLVGHYGQSYSGTTVAEQGSASMLAASVEMRYVDRWLLGRRDQFSIFHVVGPSAKIWLVPVRGVTAKAEGRLHIDFAAVRSPAYAQLTEQIGSVGTKSVLQLQDYYQGIGGSGRVGGSLGLAGFELGGHVEYGAYRSVDGLDRYYAPRDTTNTDQIIELGAFLSYKPPLAPLSARVGWDKLEHRSQMGPVSVPYVDRRLSANVSLVF